MSICSIRLIMHNEPQQTGYGVTITNDTIWDWEALPQTKSWQWPLNVYSQLRLKMGGLQKRRRFAAGAFICLLNKFSNPP